MIQVQPAAPAGDLVEGKFAKGGIEGASPVALTNLFEGVVKIILVLKVPILPVYSTILPSAL